MCHPGYSTIDDIDYENVRERNDRDGECRVADLDFVEHYRSSFLKNNDGQLVERWSPLRSPEDAARVRAQMKESLDAIAERRRVYGL